MSMSLWVVKTRCTDPAREAEFNQWYDAVHVPDVLTVPGIISGQRYKIAGPRSQGEPDVQYLALYEIDSDDPQAVVNTWRKEYGPKWRDAGRVIDCIAPVSLTTFTPLGERQVESDRSTEARSIWIVPTRCTDSAREDEFNRWYDDIHVPDMLATPHMLSGRRYKLAGPPSPGEPLAQYLALYELDTEAPQVALEQTLTGELPRLVAAGRMNGLIKAVSMTTYTMLGARQEASAIAAGSRSVPASPSAMSPIPSVPDRER